MGYKVGNMRCFGIQDGTTEFDVISTQLYQPTTHSINELSLIILLFVWKSDGVQMPANTYAFPFFETDIVSQK